MKRLNERRRGSAPAAQDQKPPRLNADGSLTFTMPPLITDALAHLAELVDRFSGEVRTLCENSPDGDFVSLVWLNSLADRWAEVDRYAVVLSMFMPTTTAYSFRRRASVRAILRREPSAISRT